VKRILKSVFIITIVAVAMIGVMVPSAIAVPSVTISFDKEEYYTGDVIKMTGNIFDYDGDTKINFFVYDPDRIAVISEEIRVRTNGEFAKTFEAGSSFLMLNQKYDIKAEMIWIPGEYTVSAHYGLTSAKDTAVFQYNEGENPKTNSIVTSPYEIHCGGGTTLVNGVCQMIENEPESTELENIENSANEIEKAEVELEKNQNESKVQGGGCLIATATYGSEMANEVQQLRELRDNQLLQTESGTAFMETFNDIYYSFSPIIADYERENPYFKEAVKIVITPMISSLSLMENAESESEVLGIGISVIALNLAMYLGVPAIVVIGIRKRF
jgi:hypothetical protein